MAFWMPIAAGAAGSVFNKAFGGSPSGVRSSGAFNPIQVGNVGTAFGTLLENRLKQDPQDTLSFRNMTEGLREQVERMGGTHRQRLMDTATTGGWLDSGAMQGAQLDIDRAEMQSYSAGVREILEFLEDRRTRDVMPYLSGASQENMGLQQLLHQSALAQRGQNFTMFSDYLGPMLSESIGNWGGGAKPGGSGGNP